MSMVHEKLYRSTNLSRIAFDDYILELTSDQMNTWVGKNSVIEKHFDLDYVEIDIDKAIPCGLLINELISNALKHGLKKPHHRQYLAVFEKTGRCSAHHRGQRRESAARWIYPGTHRDPGYAADRFAYAAAGWFTHLPAATAHHFLSWNSASKLPGGYSRWPVTWLVWL